MGYNTAVMILNDAMDGLKTDPNAGINLYNAIVNVRRGQPESFCIGNHGNGGAVLPSQHADNVQLVAVGYNQITSVATLWNLNMDDPHAICRELAESLGYRLVKKS